MHIRLGVNIQKMVVKRREGIHSKYYLLFDQLKVSNFERQPN